MGTPPSKHPTNKKMKITHTLAGEYVAQATYSEKDILKGAGFRWDPARKQWTTKSLDVAKKLVKAFDAEAQKALEAEEEKKTATKAISNASQPSEGFSCPSPADKHFYPYQLAGVQFAVNRPSTLLADEMGVGKTAQATGVINSTDVKDVLVICPASLKLNWMNELTGWLSKPARVVVLYSTGKHRISGPENAPLTVYIVNYDIVGKMDLKSRVWDLMILDEVHYLKNAKSNRRKAVWGGRTPTQVIQPIQAKRTLALTGTPVCNRPSELWSLLRGLDGGRWGSGDWQRFHVRYCGGKKTRFGWDVSGATNLEELNDLLRSTIMIRRTKKDVLGDLPEKTRKITTLEVNKELRTLLSKEAALQQIKDSGGLEKADPALVAQVASSFTEDPDQTVIGMLAKVRRMLGEIKAPLAVEYAKELLEGGLESLVIFAHHKSVVSALEEGLKDYGVVKVIGDMGGEERQQAVEAFQKAEGENPPRVFIGSITAAGVGITLTRASHSLFTEVDWVPGNLSQAEDRTHRVGQKNAVTSEYLIFEGSVDTLMTDAVAGKNLVINQITA